MARRRLDFYETNDAAVRALVKHVSIGGIVFEPCAGKNAITRALVKHVHGLPPVLTNDLDTQCETHWHFDARCGSEWDTWTVNDTWKSIDWVVTNPPFSSAYDMLLASWTRARVGIAMLLRLSFLEPTAERASFLMDHTPSTLIVLPRYSFTGDGSTDSVTCAWMVWYPRMRNVLQRMVIDDGGWKSGRPLLETGVNNGHASCTL